MNFKMIGALRINAGTSLWVTKIDGVTQSPALECPLAAGLYYVTGTGGSDDLLNLLEQAFVNQVGDDLIFSVNSSGIISHEVSGIASAEISWSVPAGESGGSSEYVQAWLRLDDNTDPYTVTTTPISGYRTHAYGYYPAYYLQTDLERYEARAAQLVPDNGNVQTIKIARRKKYRLKIRSAGFPREAGYNEYHALEDWHDHASSGRPFRLYSDTDVTSAYATSSRYGYQTMVLEPKEFEPAPLQGNWYRHMEWDFLAHEHT